MMMMIMVTGASSKPQHPQITNTATSNNGRLLRQTVMRSPFRLRKSM